MTTTVSDVEGKEEAYQRILRIHEEMASKELLDYVLDTETDRRHAPGLSPLKMGNPDYWDSRYDMLYRHPTRRNEYVARFMVDVDGFELCPLFVRECFEASKDGGNPLLDFVNDHFPRM